MSALSKQLEGILKERLEAVTEKITLQKAKELRNRVKSVALIWKKDVISWMDTTPAPGMPTRRTGQLINALHYETERLKKLPNGGYLITVRQYWNRTRSKHTGVDYGSIINEQTRVAGYRDRVRQELEQAIDKVIGRRYG